MEAAVEEAAVEEAAIEEAAVEEAAVEDAAVEATETTAEIDISTLVNNAEKMRTSRKRSRGLVRL